jgi:hypothetical protein
MRSIGETLYDSPSRSRRPDVEIYKALTANATRWPASQSTTQVSRTTGVTGADPKANLLPTLAWSDPHGIQETLGSRMTWRGRVKSMQLAGGTAEATW